MSRYSRIRWWLGGFLLRCSKCNSENPEGKKFCGKCGGKLARRCPKCGAENPPGNAFCGECGTSLAANAAVTASGAPKVASTSPAILVVAEQAEASTLDGERKTVTALFADIKGSMDLMEDLDPEAARAVIDPALRLMIDAVHRYDGYIVQSTGDGIFALFGAPLAHEDHPQRALYAALRMQEDMNRYSSKLRAAGNPPLEARVGVNTGETVVRSIKTGDAHTEYTPIGHSTSLAARMQTLAPTGSIATTSTTQKLCAGYFEFKELGPARVKGVSEPVLVFEVIGLGPLRTRLQRAAGRGLTKFVGRDREIEALRHAATLARDGHGQIAAAMAVAGTGKSRLFLEFKATSAADWLVLETFSVSHGKASAYLPVIDLLHNYFKIAGEDDPLSRREKVAGKLALLDRSFEDTLPYLFALLGIVDGNDPLADMTPEIRKRRTLDAIKRILLRESLKQPLIVIFEDLHWIDSETQAFLNLLADSIGTAKVLILVNYRPEYSHQWNSKTYYTQLRLDPLGKESAGEMLTALLGDAPEVRPLKLLIVERTGGNPFFMEETFQVLLDEGALVREGSAVRLTKPLSELKIPPTVQDILAARIDRLPADEKDLLQTLAIIGKQFQLSLVRAVTGRSDEELHRMLDNLQLAEFIYEQPAAGDIEYSFVHALTQEVADNSVLTERRRTIHQRTADAIEANFKERLEDHFSELAHHYLLTDDYSKAIHYSQAAAQQAANRLAYTEATNTLEAALKLLGKLPDDAERNRVELALRTTQHTVAAIVHGFASNERLRAIEQICELNEKLGETTVQLRGLVNLGLTYFPRGEALRTREIGKRCLKLAEFAEDSEVLAAVHLAAGYGAHSCGRLDEAVTYFQQTILHARKANRRGFIPIDAWTSGTTQLACVLQLLGRGAQAAVLLEEGLHHAHQAQDLFNLGLGLTVNGWFYQYRREPQIVLTHADAAIALANEHGFPEWTAWGLFLRGWAQADLGHVAEGVLEMQAGINGFSRLGGVPRMQFARALLAHGYHRLGRNDEAPAILDQAITHVERSGEMLDTAEMLRLKGEFRLERDGSGAPEAERCYRAAIELAREQQARWWELRATVSLARLRAKQGHSDEARAMLADIYQWFTEGFDTADLKDAKALLEELSGQS
jgi:class 3 adenylate cyclase/tetratricopeptide (TPR) repeat protein